MACPWLAVPAHSADAVHRRRSQLAGKESKEPTAEACDRDTEAVLLRRWRGGGEGLLEGDAGGGGARRRRAAGGGGACPSSGVPTETFEKVGSVGVAANLTVYLVKATILGSSQQTLPTSLRHTELYAIARRLHLRRLLGKVPTLAYGSSLASCSSSQTTRLQSAARLGGHCNSPSTLQLSVLYLSLAFLTIGVEQSTMQLVLE
ncbi:hypothetical protein ZWY2020_052207 [Hordeum vulgare]|nr:hypothetical protein ZWY2020_052207 [Hordeum vulgare]